MTKYERYKDITPPRVKGSRAEVAAEEIAAARSAKLSSDERLQKVIARSGLASRRGAEDLVCCCIRC